MNASATLSPTRQWWRRALGPSTVEAMVSATALVTGPITSRALGDAGRGSMAAVVVPTQLLMWTLWLGVPYGSAMLVREHTNSLLVDNAWRLAIIVGLPACALAWLAAPMLLHGHPDSTVAWFRIGLLGAILSIPVTTAIELRLIEHGGHWTWSVARNLAQLTTAGAIVALAVADRLTLNSTLLCWIGGFVLSQAVLVAVLHARPRTRGAGPLLREQLLIGRANAVIVMATVSLSRVDQVVLGIIASPGTLGAYAVAATAAQISLPIAQGVSDIVMPDAFAADDPAHSARHATLLVFAASAAVALVSCAVAPWLLPALFGEPFHRSVRYLWILAPGQAFFNTAWVLRAHLLGRREGRSAATAIVISALCNLALIVPAVHAFGAVGAASLTTLCQAVFLAAVLRSNRAPRRTVVAA